MLNCNNSPNQLFDGGNKIKKTENTTIADNFENIELTKYFIKEGSHSPKNRFIKFHSTREFSIVCKFDSSCIYSFDNDKNLAINKIFGLAFGWNHHWNSFRIGWRCKDDLIEILAYWYVDKKRFDKGLFFVTTDKRFYVNVRLVNNQALIIYKKEKEEKFNKVNFVFNSNDKAIPEIGYVNYPYFGGTNKTPHNMTIYLKAWLN